MDIYTLALSIAYTNKTIKAAELEGFKVQVETTRDILEMVGEEKTFYFLPKVVSEPQNGYDEYIYVNDSWELMGSTDIDLSGYMTLASLNPTAAQIVSMSDGQFYGDTVNHKGVVKGGQEFYDTTYVDENYRKTVVSDKYPQSINGFNAGDTWICCTPSSARNRTFVFYKPKNYDGIWLPLNNYLEASFSPPPNYERFDNINYIYRRFKGDEYIHTLSDGTKDFYKLINVDTTVHGTQYAQSDYTWLKIYSSSKIDSMIGDIETALSEV